MLFVTYYSILFFCVSIYYITMRKFEGSFYTMSSINYVTSFFFVMLPGYFIANNTLTYFDNSVNLHTALYNEVDLLLYFIYLSFVIVSTVILITAHLSARNIYMNINSKYKIEKRLIYALIIFICYIILYFLWTPVVPIWSLFKSGVSAAAHDRLMITHGLKDIDPPFIFKYWRNIMQVFLPCVTLYFINIKMPKLLKMLILVFQFFVLVFTLEKGPLINFIIGMLILDGYLSKKYNRISHVRKISILAFISIIGLYGFFMSSTAPIASISRRIAIQTAVTPYEINYVRNNGFLGMEAISMPIIDAIFERKTINISKNAIIELYPGSNSEKLSGAAGGLSLVDLYISFGNISFLIFILYVYMFGFIDRIIFNSLKTNLVLTSFYFAFNGMNMFALTGSVFHLFSIPWLFSPLLILFLFFSYFFLSCNFKFYKRV